MALVRLVRHGGQLPADDVLHHHRRLQISFTSSKVAAGEFRGLDAAGVENAFGAMQGNVGIQLLFMGIVVVLGMLICSRGLKNGVEKVNKAMMLCLLALLVVLAVRALTLPGAMEGVKFYLVPNFHDLMYDAHGDFSAVPRHL